MGMVGTVRPFGAEVVDVAEIRVKARPPRSSESNQEPPAISHFVAGTGRPGGEARRHACARQRFARYCPHIRFALPAGPILPYTGAVSPCRPRAFPRPSSALRAATRST